LCAIGQPFLYPANRQHRRMHGCPAFAVFIFQHRAQIEQPFKALVGLYALFPVYLTQRVDIGIAQCTIVMAMSQIVVENDLPNYMNYL
jgi:hypothetical protein